MEDEKHFEYLQHKLKEASDQLDILMDILIKSWINEPTSKFVKKINSILDEFPDANLSCYPDPSSGLGHGNPDHPRFNRIVRFAQDGEMLGYFTVLIEKHPFKQYKKRKYLAIKGTVSHPIPISSTATAIVNKNVEFRFQAMLKTLITTKYQEHPHNQDNVQKCKTIISELEKMLFRMA